VRTALGRVVPASETVWMRTREVWVHAVDLDNGGSFGDFPAELVDALLADVVGAWRRRLGPAGLPPLVLEPTDREDTYPLVPDGTAPAGMVTPRGTAPALAWGATGRGAAGVLASDGGAVPPPPRWL
jgi:maleylpyruvate isomerase